MYLLYPPFGEEAVGPIWRTMAVLFLVVAVLLAFTLTAMVIVVCHTKKGSKSNQPSHSANQQGAPTYSTYTVHECVMAFFENLKI